MSVDPKDIRNVAVVGHNGTGKTSLVESMLYYTGAIPKAELVAGGKTTSDYTEEEISRKISVHTALASTEWMGKRINILDTPGTADFIGEAICSFRTTEAALMLVDARDGAQIETIKLWRRLDTRNKPRAVFINKMDKEGANPDRIKQQLTEYSLVPEEWGGDTICVPVSAKTQMGIDSLLESILLVAEMLELKANPKRAAKGVVIEARLDKGRGPIATLLVQNGTLHAGDIVVAGSSVGRVRVMVNERGRRLKEAGPSVPVEVMGLDETPNAGDGFDTASDEKLARQLVEQRKQKAKEEQFKAFHKVTFDNLFASIKDGEMKELNIIVKADVQGSVEAVTQNLVKLSNDEVKVKVILGGVGAINDSDVMLANASNAIIVGFNVRPDPNAQNMAERDGVEMRMYRVIYDCIEEIEAAMKGMLAPKFREVIIGHAEVRQTFRVSKVGTVCGCYVQDGRIQRNCSVRVNRDNIVIFEGELASLRRFKDDVKEVAAGYECGMQVEKFNDIKEGDIIECFVTEQL